MIPIFSLGFLLLTPLILAAIVYRRPQFPFSWLIAASFALLSLIGLFGSYNQISSNIQIINWQTAGVLPYSLYFFLDEISWSFGLAVVALLIAYLLNSTQQYPEPAPETQNTAGKIWLAWGSPLIASGLGLASVLAGDLLTLIILWAALDVYELFLRLFSMDDTNDINPILASFGVRTAGLITIIWAMVGSGSSSFPTGNDQTDVQFSILLLVGAFLRMGVIPLTLPLTIADNSLTRLSQLLRLLPVASAFMLLTRLSSLIEIQVNAVFALCILLAAITGSFLWSFRQKRQGSEPYWLLTAAAFLIITSIYADVSVSLSVGIGFLIAGGLFFFNPPMVKRLIPIGFLGPLAITMLPGTAGWYGVNLYSSETPGFIYFFLLPQALLIAGYVNWILGQKISSPNQVRINSLINSLGVLLLPIIQYAITYLVLYRSEAIGKDPPSIFATWPAFVAALTAAILVILIRRFHNYEILSLNNKNFGRLRSTMANFSIIIFQTLSSGISFVDQLIEGRGSILWTILFLTLVISILTNIGA